MSDALHRYLVPFSPKQIPHFFTDVLIIGAGLAGLRRPARWIRVCPFSC